jgi:hypothetical protein
MGGSSPVQTIAGGPWQPTCHVDRSRPSGWGLHIPITSTPSATSSRWCRRATHSHVKLPLLLLKRLIPLLIQAPVHFHRVWSIWYSAAICRPMAQIRSSPPTIASSNVGAAPLTIARPVHRTHKGIGTNTIGLPITSRRQLPLPH